MRDTFRTVALVFGVIYTIVGILGFILNPNGGNLLGIFAVDMMHNSVHLIVGLLGIALSFTNFARLYLQVFGVVFLLLAVIGFIMAPSGGDVLGMAMNTADHVLHLLTGVILGYFGFLYRQPVETRTRETAREIDHSAH